MNEFLSSLPERQVSSGAAEMLKHGLIADAAYWHLLKNSNLSAPSEDLIYRSVEIKNEVVTADPFERGIRKSLNFGHTIGHALETNSLLHDTHPLTHGEAIAIGMICESYLSHKKSGLTADELREIVTVLNNRYPHYSLAESSYRDLCALMLKDKKNEKGRVNCTLLTRIGQCSLDNICTDEELCESLSFYAQL